MRTTKCSAITLNKLYSYYYTVFLNINKERLTLTSIVSIHESSIYTLVKTESWVTNAIVHQNDTFSLCPPPLDPINTAWGRGDSRYRLLKHW